MLRKPGGELRPKLETVTSDILSVPEEWELLTMVSEFPEVIESAADGMNPSLLTTYLYELAKTFSRYYHDHPILTADDEELRAARLELARGIQGVLRKGLELINVPFLEVM
jgi:arginyl-tRNA synthetase